MRHAGIDWKETEEQVLESMLWPAHSRAHIQISITLLTLNRCMFICYFSTYPNVVDEFLLSRRREKFRI
jgi:hypothetical protein